MSRHRHPPWLFAALVFLSTIVVVTFFTPTQPFAGVSGTQLQAVLQTGSENAVPDGSGVNAEAAVSGQTSLNAANYSGEAFDQVTWTNQPEVWFSSDLAEVNIFGTLESDQNGFAVLITFGQTIEIADETQKAAADQTYVTKRGADSTTQSYLNDVTMRIIIRSGDQEGQYDVVCPIEATDVAYLSVMGQSFGSPDEALNANRSSDETTWVEEVPFNVIWPIFEEGIVDLGWSRTANTEAPEHLALEWWRSGGSSEGRDLVLGWWKTADNEGRQLTASFESTTRSADSSG